jgi:hypothetical protein
MRRFALAGHLCALAALAALAAHADDVGPALGKERAAASRTQWETRAAAHPKLGKVNAAVTRSPVETRAGDNSVFTRALVSCDPATRRMAIELANTEHRSQEPGNLAQGASLALAAPPVLLCSRPIAPWDAKLVQEERSATWEIDAESGAALARGLRPFPLHECVVIRAEQTVVLANGQKARVDFDILPYGRELDAIFAACGERSAYAQVDAKPSANPAPKAEPTWRRARVLGTGKTNVRATPSLQAAVVAQVPAGSAVMVQPTDTEWWRAKATRSGGFTGYIRQDRLAFD